MERAESISRQANVVAAMTLEVLKGSTRAFDSSEWSPFNYKPIRSKTHLDKTNHNGLGGTVATSSGIRVVESGFLARLLTHSASLETSLKSKQWCERPNDVQSTSDRPPLVLHYFLVNYFRR